MVVLSSDESEYTLMQTVTNDTYLHRITNLP